jgi:hypothetical protein
VRLRDVELGDVDAYVRMRCDPVMMADLGGPLPREGLEDKVARDVRAVAADADWIKMIVPDEAEPDAVAGNVVVGAAPADAVSPAGKNAFSENVGNLGVNSSD